MRMLRGLWIVVCTAGVASALMASAVAAAAASGAAPANAATPATAAPAASATAATTAAPATADEATLYALGVLLSRNQALAALSLSDAELKHVLAGFSDGYRHHAHIDDPQSYLPKLQSLQAARQQAFAEHQKQAGEAFIAKVAALPGARKTPSGLVYVSSVEGSGRSPSAADSVKVQYTGKLIDGTVFDSSVRRGEPATFPLGGIIPCWKEALQLMKVGGKARVVCPAALAYGDRGPPTIGPGATLDFDIELLEVMPAAASPATPATPGASAGQAAGAQQSKPAQSPH